MKKSHLGSNAKTCTLKQLTCFFHIVAYIKQTKEQKINLFQIWMKNEIKFKHVDTLRLMTQELLGIQEA
jgi:hypothetical protein